METTETNDLIRALSQPLYQSRGWMKLIGVMMILYGTLVAITIVGIIVASMVRDTWDGGCRSCSVPGVPDAQINS